MSVEHCECKNNRKKIITYSKFLQIMSLSRLIMMKIRIIMTCYESISSEINFKCFLSSDTSLPTKYMIFLSFRDPSRFFEF